jgi:molybdate transport system substrate-binding protein
MKKIRIFIIFALFASGTLACQPVSVDQASRQSVTVFAAASLTESFSELANLFEAEHPNADIILNFAGSNTLRAQIENGAPADIFASANTKEMDALVESGIVAADAAQIFLHNRLVVIVPANNPAGLNRFDDFRRTDLKLDFAAEEVPVGKYTRQMLANVSAEFSEDVLAQVVSNESDVKQVVAKIQLGEADAGIVYASDAVAAPELVVIEIPAEYNVLATYPIAPLTDSPLAQTFISFVLSPEGQAVLEKWGFTPID